MLQNVLLTSSMHPHCDCMQSDFMQQTLYRTYIAVDSPVSQCLITPLSILYACINLPQSHQVAAIYVCIIYGHGISL